MKKRILFIFKLIVFAAIIIVILTFVTKVVMEKSYYGDGFPNTATFEGLYDLEPESVDVIFLGSSHGANGFIPQVLYDNYGLTGYNLSCGQQNLLVSFYWLKEALRFQRPKVVVLDTYMLYEYTMSEALNTPETATRQAMDPMKWSINKVRAVRAIASLDSNQSIESYVFPIERYHSRWTELSKEDFTFNELKKRNELMGYAYSEAKTGNTYEGLSIGEEDKPAYILDNMRKYLDEIVWFCDTNDMKLVLVKTPALQETAGRYLATKEYADQNNIPFIEMNFPENLAAMGFDFAEDMSSGGHANIVGAAKITDYLGDHLVTQYDLTGNEKDAQWKKNHDYYDKVMQNLKIKECTDELQYAKYISNPTNVTLIAVNSSVSGLEDSILAKELEKMGLRTRMEFGDSFYAVIEDGSVIQEHKTGEIASYDGILMDGLLDFHIRSEGVSTLKEGCSIMFDDVEYAKNRKGYNIVIYDKETHNVIDSMWFDGTINR